MSGYKKLIEAAIEREKDILGEELAVNIAQDVAELEITDDGKVENINDGGKHALAKLVESYQDIGGAVSASLIAKELKENGIGEDLDLPEKLQERM